MPFLSQLTCLLLLQTSCVALTHVNQSVNNNSNSNNGVNVDQGKQYKEKSKKQKSKHHKFIMYRNNKMLKMTKEFNNDTNDNDNNKIIDNKYDDDYY